MYQEHKKMNQKKNVYLCNFKNTLVVLLLWNIQDRLKKTQTCKKLKLRSTSNHGSELSKMHQKEKKSPLSS